MKRANSETRNLNRLSYFVAIVEEGTITAAAKRLNLSKAVVSKHLQLLEQEVGVNLLVRNTRNLHVSEAGEAFYLRSKAVLIQASEAFDSVESASNEPVGHIRITATLDFGIHHLSRLIAQFSQEHPHIDIELELNDGQMDLVEHRFDLAVRVGWLKDSSNRARKLGDFREVVVCEKKTAKQWNISQPKELESHPYIAFSGFNDIKRKFSKGSTKRTVNMQSNLKINITTAIHESILAGGCFSILPEFIVKNELATGKLVELLPDWRLRNGGIFIISPPSRLRTKAVELLLERMVSELHV